MLHEDRPTLLNKLSYFGIAAAVALTLLFVFAPRDARPDSGSVIPGSAFMASCLFGVLFCFSLFASWSKRWSFSVYPGRVKLRSKRRSFDIQLARITGVEVISYSPWHPRDWWPQWKLYCNPRYPMYGAGQLLKVRENHEILRVDCPHRGWRKGYYLNMEDPRPFLQTLNRALQRVRLMQTSARSKPASEHLGDASIKAADLADGDSG
jgi:hypothetical protein